MSGAILLILAWIGAVLWPLALVLVLGRGLVKGRGPGWFGWTAIVVVTAAWGLGIRAFLWEPETLVVRRVEVVSAAWKGEPLRVGVIADIHAAGPHMTPERLDGIVAQMNSEQPDIVLLLGDYVSGSAPAVQRAPVQRAEVMAGIQPLKGLRAPLGVWSVLGNHDWWYDGDAIRKGIEALGIRVLENERAQVARPGGVFWLGGLADYDSKRAQPSYGQTLKDLPEGEDPVIVMSHWPDAFALAPDRVFITFAGHTHCGQVNLPLLGRLVLPSPGAEKWPCGLYDQWGRKLYVSGGVGVSIVPVRFNQPPEIAVVTLRRD
jgi:predicted MPP superfamily phosphohydrolase